MQQIYHYIEIGYSLDIDWLGLNNLSWISKVRSETIATYALCGFANIGSLGVMIGGLCKYRPHGMSTSTVCEMALRVITVLEMH